ncbi:type II inositol 1,4,5-trisphosphate 5-phosphatase-like [Zophobas morio]|uniref:type II inositol 1,4,5-trisphosphate 5-phosphatase-like n=1 Tax=Zophobas morio TaxID=2755281 RepID=UPI0030839012
MVTPYSRTLEGLLARTAPVRSPCGHFDENYILLKTRGLLSSGKALTVPAELRILVDYIYKYGSTEPGVFCQAGSSLEGGIIAECLATGESLEGLEFNIHSVCSALCLFLTSLPDSVIPSRLCEHIVSSTKPHDTLEKLPVSHRNVYVFMIQLAKELLQRSSVNGLSREKISLLYAKILYPPVKKKANSAQKYEKIMKKRSCFIAMFL